MKLPKKENAYIPVSKIIDYLLSETHTIGKSKAKLLRTVGFNESNVFLLKEGLMEIARSEDVTDVVSSTHGAKYVIDGLLKTPDEGFIKMKTVWIIDRGHEQPRFVTAYPVTIGKED